MLRVPRAPFVRGAHALCALLMVMCAMACTRKVERKKAAVEHTPSASPANTELAPPRLPAPTDACLLQATALAAEPQVPGAPMMEGQRAEILGRARAVPLVFFRVPQLDPTGLSEDELRLAKKFRALLEQSQDPAVDIQAVLRRTAKRYALRRAIFLSEGYLYAETPRLALRLAQTLRLDHLFDEEQVLVQRGEVELVAKLEEGRYYLPDEPVVGVSPPRMQHGPPAGLILFDRVRGREQGFGPSVAFGMRALQRELGFDTARPIVRGHAAWVFELNTRGVLSTAVVDVGAVEARLMCESSAPGEAQMLERMREQALDERRLVEPVLAAAREIIARGLPFDEPRTEDGQQDGLLRIAFRKAHRERRETYEFNGDSYYTYDGFGRPRLPEVCIDFINDAFDWGTGGFWPGRGKKAQRVKGALNFESLGIENERSVESLLNYAATTPAWFEVHFTDKREQVKIAHREKFFAWLTRTQAVYRPGDIVFIYGLRDDEKFHYHSFLVDEKDPISGMIMLVMANAGPPQARTVEGEMQNAPLRTIVARIRLRSEILKRAYDQAQAMPGEPLAPPLPPIVETPPAASDAAGL